MLALTAQRDLLSVVIYERINPFILERNLMLALTAQRDLLSVVIYERINPFILESDWRETFCLRPS
jgi:hypothetical protein